jgi:hypothetical protein
VWHGVATAVRGASRSATSWEAVPLTENDLFYWPPGHSVRAVKDSEVVLFSPQREHAHAMDHMLKAMKG